MSCRVFRDIDTDAVERVVTKTGEPSQLYNEALKVLKNEEEALNVWAYAHTPSFSSIYGDWNNSSGLFNLNSVGEPILSDVLTAMSLNDTETKLGLQDSINVLSMMGETGLDVNTLYSTLKRAFFNNNGQFTVDRKKILATGLYTNDEISQMMEYPSVRGEIVQTLNKLKNSLSGEGNVFEDIQGFSFELDHPLRINTGEINNLGKSVVLPIEEVESYIVDNLGLIAEDTDLVNEISSLDREDIREAILNNPDSIEYVRSLLESMKAVPVFVSRGGVLMQKNVHDNVELLANTVTVNDSKLFFTETIDSLREIPEEEWYGNPENVMELLDFVEQQGARTGLDLTGLKAQYSSKSQEEIVGFLDLVDDFNIKTEDLTLTDEDIFEFSNDMAEFFETEVESATAVIPVVEQFRDSNLILIEGEVNEVDIYRTDGLIKAYGNLYQRVDNYNSYQDALEATYTAIQSDMTILPTEAYKDFGLKNGYYDVKAVTNPLNKNKVLNSINNFVSKRLGDTTAASEEDYDLQKEIALMKGIFNPVEIKEQAVDNIASRQQSFTGDYRYLTTDFISDFYMRMLEEKVINKSELWDTDLKYFTINDRGIDLTTQSPEILSQIKLVMQSEPILFSNLVNYSLISKNTNLEFLQEFSSEPVMSTINTRRDFVTNNPSALPRLSKEYVKVTDDTLIIKNSTDEFVRLNDGIYELTASDNGVSTYARLITGVNPNFYEFGLSYPIVESIDINSFKDPTTGEFSRKSYSLSEGKLKEMQDELSCKI